MTTEDRPEAPSLTWWLWGVAVSASAFGPYLVGGIRTEQLTLYLSAFVALFLIRRPTATFVVVTATWLGLVAILVTIAMDPPPSTESLGSFVPGLDNAVLPVACLVVSAAWASRGAVVRRRMIDTICATICVLLAVNAGLALASVLHDPSFLRDFWASDAALDTVSARAAQLGRYGGIFNQPAEAGMAYSVGSVCAMWRWRWREQRIVPLALALTAMTLGAFLAVSKVFLFVGIPVLFLLSLSPGRHRVRDIAIIGVGVGSAVLAVSSRAVSWDGADRLASILSNSVGSQDRFKALTAGRFGSESTLASAIDTVMGESPWIGFGVHGLDIAYDSTIVEVLAQGGLLGLAVVVAISAVVVRRWGHGQGMDSDERRLSGGLLLVLLGSSFGLASGTANRVGSLVWLLLGLALIHVAKSDKGASMCSRPGSLVKGRPPVRGGG